MSTRIQTVGFVVRDAELRTTKTGKVITVFSVASHDRKRDAAGNWTDAGPVQFWDCVDWTGRVKGLKKGQLVTVTGSLRLEEFQRKDGTPGKGFKIHLNELDTVQVVRKPKKEEQTQEQGPEPVPEPDDDWVPEF